MNTEKKVIIEGVVNNNAYCPIPVDVFLDLLCNKIINL
jgi:hypothetical protein